MKKSYKKLLMWQKAHLLVLLIYRHCELFPKHELYGLTSQLRRASLSVVLNIIEGYARRTDGDLRRFLDISLGSLTEVEYLLELSRELEYLSNEAYDEIELIREECGKLLWSYRNKYQIIDL